MTNIISWGLCPSALSAAGFIGADVTGANFAQAATARNLDQAVFRP